MKTTNFQGMALAVLLTPMVFSQTTTATPPSPPTPAEIVANQVSQLTPTARPHHRAAGHGDHYLHDRANRAGHHQNLHGYGPDGPSNGRDRRSSSAIAAAANQIGTLTGAAGFGPGHRRGGLLRHSDVRSAEHKFGALKGVGFGGPGPGGPGHLEGQEVRRRRGEPPMSTGAPGTRFRSRRFR